MRALAPLALAAFVSAAAAAPSPPGESCQRIGIEIGQVRSARQEAVEKGENAWKAVLPFVVIARKASSQAAVDEADKRLAALRGMAQAEGCDAP